jgi:hypothetical protein
LCDRRTDSSKVDPSPPPVSRLNPAAAAGALTFLVAIAVDLTTKAYAISLHRPHLVVYNNANPDAYVRRVVMSLVAIAATYVLDRGARRLGIGRLWGAWIGAGLLAGGVLSNGVSRVIWARGVPDFIHLPSYIWNVADFEIGIGLTCGILSIGVTALVAYVRERLAAPAVDGS